MKNKIRIFLWLSFFISLQARAQNPSTSAGADSPSAPMVKIGFIDQLKPIESKSSISWNGDLRYRLQNEIDNVSDERKRHRLQARLGMIAQVQNDLKVNLRLMTGSSATSGNQDLGEGGGMPRRSMGIDQAYATYDPAAWSTLLVGKMQSPFVFAGKSQVFWDRDLSPEGMALRLHPLLADGVILDLNMGSFWIKENYSTGTDTADVMLNSAQLVAGFRYMQTNLNFIFSSFSYTNVKDLKPADIVSGGGFKGNSADSSSNYANGYEISQIGIEAKIPSAFGDWTVYAENSKNSKISTENTATAFGLGLGIKDFNLMLTQQSVQKDSVLSLFTDGDFANGNTSSKGTVASLSYNFNKQISSTAAFFENQYEVETANPKNYRRSQLDLLIKF